MVGTRDMRVYTGLGLHVQFELLAFLCLDVCSGDTNWSGEGLEAKVLGSGESCSLKAYVCFGLGVNVSGS
jgi:hypothetical protein